MNYNISALFIHNFKLKRTYQNFYKNCGYFKCKTCLFFSSDHYINIKDEFIVIVRLKIVSTLSHANYVKILILLVKRTVYLLEIIIMYVT